MHLSLRFLWGLISVFLYAALRPRFGPGPRTALIVAAALWSVGYVPFTVMLWELGLLDAAMAGFVVIWGLLETVATTLVGAAVYREEG